MIIIFDGIPKMKQKQSLERCNKKTTKTTTTKNIDIANRFLCAARLIILCIFIPSLDLWLIVSHFLWVGRSCLSLLADITFDWRRRTILTIRLLSFFSFRFIHTNFFASLLYFFSVRLLNQQEVNFIVWRAHIANTIDSQPKSICTFESMFLTRFYWISHCFNFNTSIVFVWFVCYWLFPHRLLRKT